MCFVENYIDGREFLQLSQQDLKEMIPAMGIVKKLSRLISKVYTALKFILCIKYIISLATE